MIRLRGARTPACRVETLLDAFSHVSTQPRPSGGGTISGHLRRLWMNLQTAYDLGAAQRKAATIKGEVILASKRAAWFYADL